MRAMVSRTSAGRCTYASVVISPKIVASPVVTIVSHATRDAGSFASSASTTASEIWSATLSGWPSVTDSDVNRWRRSTEFRPVGGGINNLATSMLRRRREEGQSSDESEYESEG